MGSSRAGSHSRGNFVRMWVELGASSTAWGGEVQLWIDQSELLLLA